MTITVSPLPTLKITFWKTAYNKETQMFDFIKEYGQDVCVDIMEFQTIGDLEKCRYMIAAQSSEIEGSKFSEFKLSHPIGGSGRTCLVAKYESGKNIIIGWSDSAYTVATLESIFEYL